MIFSRSAPAQCRTDQRHPGLDFVSQNPQSKRGGIECQDRQQEAHRFRELLSVVGCQ